MTPQQAVDAAVNLLEWAEQAGADVAWYVTDRLTWDELTPETRMRVATDRYEIKAAADFLRSAANQIDGAS